MASSMSAFHTSCSWHLTNISKAFELKGNEAHINARKGQLLNLFDSKMRNINLLEKTTATSKDRESSFKTLEGDLQLLHNDTLEFQKKYSGLPKAQDLCNDLLEKIKAVTERLQQQPQSIPSAKSASKKHRSPAATFEQSQKAFKKQAEEDLEFNTQDLLYFDNKPGEVYGIKNEGNDCFQNALLQALLTPEYKTHVLDRLPDSTRKHLAKKKDIPTKTLRKELNSLTGFTSSSSQEDAHELFVKLFDFFDKETLPQAPPAPFTSPQAPEKESSLIEHMQNGIDKKNIIFRVFLYSFFIPFKAVALPCEKILNCFENNTQDDEIGATPPIIEEEIQLSPRITQETPNPLKFSFETTRTWDVSNVQEPYKNDEKFGGAGNHTTKSGTKDLNPNKHEYQNHLSITIENEQEPFNLQQAFDACFQNNMYSHSDDDPQVTAPCKETLRFESIPSALMLHIRRSKVMQEDLDHPLKLFNTAVSLSSRLTIPQDNFTDAAKPNADVTMKLKSFIVHKGERMSSGHYVAFRQVGNEWFYFNDSTCQKITEEAALRAAKHGYMYFFEKEEA